MQSPLAHCRYALSRHFGIRALLLLTVLGLLINSVPRWQLHQHRVADPDHAHAALVHAHHHEVVDSARVDDAALVTHCHATPSFSIALIEARVPALGRLSASADAFVSPDSTPLASCWPPPHRPPIA